MFIANVQNICDLIGRIVLLTSILYSLTKKQQHSKTVARKSRNLLIKNKLIINSQSKVILIHINH